MKRLGSVAGVLTVFILSAVALVKIYDSGKDKKPLRYADIPPETIEWINSLGENFNDIFSTFNPVPRPTPWGNGDDTGRDSEMEVLEDEYFVIYYHKSLAEKARLSLQYAHEAIPRMEEVLGRYYYPADMNGRKVPIYLAKEQRDFDSTIKELGCNGGDHSNTAGICIYEISPSGMFLNGIVLKGSYVFRDDKTHREVQWHEMTHYCFAASIDYNQRIDLPMWCTEGIAEYTGIIGRRPRFSADQIARMRQECDLSAKSFHYVFEVYDGGHSIFCHMEDIYGLSGVKSFLQTLYGRGLPYSMQHNFSKTVGEFENDWKANLDKFKY